MERLVHSVGATADDLRDCLAGLAGWWEQNRVDQFLARGVVPVLGEDLLQLPDGGTFDAQVSVAPMPDLWIGSQILVPDVHSAGESNLAVDDDDLAMATVIERPFFPKGRSRQKWDNLDPGVRHRSEKLAMQRHRAERIVEKAYLDARLRTFDQHVTQSRPRAIGLPDVILQVERFLGPQYRFLNAV